MVKYFLIKKLYIPYGLLDDRGRIRAFSDEYGLELKDILTPLYRRSYVDDKETIRQIITPQLSLIVRDVIIQLQGYGFLISKLDASFMNSLKLEMEGI